MRLITFLLFLALILGGVSYAVWHVWCVLPAGKAVKGVVVAVLLALLFSMFFFLGGRLDRMPLQWATPVYEVMTSGVFVLLYTVMLFIVLDVLRLCRVVPKEWLHNNGWMTLCIVALLTVIFVGGNLNYHHKYRKAIDIDTEKPTAGPVRVLMMSDLHLGYHNRRAEMARWVDIINGENPDVILIAGDIIDNSVKPLIEEGTAEEFRRLKAPVYACLGNHEYYSQVERARRFYDEAGITLLRDDSCVLDNGLCVVGRDDSTHRERKALREILPEGAPKDHFTILIDHQPFQLEEAQECGVDLQLSGHTHYGQVWPISWITRAIYEIAYGEGRKGDTRYYVSSGMGIWGGKYRIGTRSEYLVVEVK